MPSRVHCKSVDSAAVRTTGALSEQFMQYCTLEVLYFRVSVQELVANGPEELDVTVPSVHQHEVWLWMLTGSR